MKKLSLLNQKLLICLSLTGILLLVYGQVINFNFTNIDDQVYVTENAHIQNGISVNGIVWAFTSSHAANWHPLTSLSLMIDYDTYGLKAGGYHFTNLFFHVINTLLLFLLLNKMTGSIYRSLFVAALFGFHPLHVESVAWISARKDVLSTFFWLLTIWAYTSYSKQPEIKRYALAFIFFALGLMSKPMVVTLPFVLLLLDYWPLNRSIPIKNLIIEKIPLFVLTVASSIVTYMVQKNAGAVVPLIHRPLDMRIENALISYVRYIEKTLLPINLSLHYPHPGMWPVWQAVLAGSMIILLSFLVWRKRDRYPYLLVGWLWYLGTLVPVIGIVQVGDQAMADRYSYIPLIGLFLMIAWGVPDLFRRLPHKKAILGFGAVLIIAIFSFLSWQRCQLWRDNFALWDDVIKKYYIFLPDSIRENYMIAFAYRLRGAGSAEKGEYQKALEDYTMALKIKPDADAFYNRGLLHNELRKYNLAVLDFTSAIKLDPEMADAFLSRGIAFGSERQYDKALTDFNLSLKINPNLFQGYYNRGIVHNIYQQYDLAVADFKAALRIKPDHANAHNYVGTILVKIKKFDEARVHFNKALQIEPSHMDAAKNLQTISGKK